MATGIRHDDLRRQNRAMVLTAVRRAAGVSRTEIASMTGLSHSTISAISSDLIDEGILLQLKGAEVTALKRGRPQVALGLNPDAAHVLTIVLALNTLSLSLVDYAGGTILESNVRLPTTTMGRRELSDAVIVAIEDLLSTHSSPSLPMRASMAIQGIIDAHGRELLWSPISPHTHVPFAQMLEDRFGFPVTIENDCNMIAIALRERSPERYRDNLTAIMLSNGIGMGLILGGRLFNGSVSSGGEFGHMIHEPDGALCRCGRHGCIEAYAGNYAIMRNARSQSRWTQPDADIDERAMVALAADARAGEGPEREAFQIAGRAIGYGLGSLFALYDPTPVAIVGPGTAAFDIIEPALREALARTAGGQDAGSLRFELELDERPLIRAGSAHSALAHIDEHVFASQASTMPRQAGAA
jgi:predicted NBD/HSP70 family sugar kinase/DNA-binding XRE family transcriptional regulator